MNVEQYIQSGILESYILGGCDPAEQEEVERMSSTYPEVKAALDLLHADIEKLAATGAVTPPQALKGRIMQSIEAEIAAAKVPQRGTARTINNRLGYILAGVALSAGIFGMGVLQNRIDKINALRQADLQKIAECETRNEYLLRAENQIALLGAQTTRAVRLGALPGRSEEWQVWVYHNASAGMTLLNANSLPPSPAGKSWQLWAIVNGTPRSMGVISQQKTQGLMLDVPYIATAQAFALSLEPAGGSDTPTEVVLLGRI